MNFFLDKIINVKDKPIPEIVQSLLSIIVMGGMILFVYFINIPNPNLFLFTVMIAFTSVCGFIPGAFSLLGIYIYSLLFFSTNHSFVDFTEVNAIKTVVSFITGALCYVIVGVLNRMYKLNAIKLLKANDELLNEKKTLQEISLKDALTDTKNRHSLRNDFNHFIGNEIHLMIFDIDFFKLFNDNNGHDFGDEVLKKIANATKEIFGEESVYRFGGDEFIVITKDDTYAEFEGRVKKLQEEVKNIRVNDKDYKIRLSIGFTYGVPTDNSDLRQMIKFADELLYQVKKSGKNNYIGKRYVLDLMDN